MRGKKKIAGKPSLRRVLLRCVLSGLSAVGAFGHSSLIFAEEVAPVSSEQPAPSSPAPSPSDRPFVLEIPPPTEEI